MALNMGLSKRAVYDYRNNAHLQIIHAFQHREKSVALSNHPFALMRVNAI